QAEDGIRARNVTGVQTCALPIFIISWSVRMDGVSKCCSVQRPRDGVSAQLPPMGGQNTSRQRSKKWISSPDERIEQTIRQRIPRSEERRVGKACRWRWMADEYSE